MRAVCFIKDVPELVQAVETMNTHATNLKERMLFLKKQQETALEDAKKQADQFWRQLEYDLKAKGMILDYDLRKHHLHLDTDLGVLVMHDNNQCQMADNAPPEIIRAIIAHFEKS